MLPRKSSDRRQSRRARRTTAPVEMTSIELHWTMIVTFPPAPTQSPVRRLIASPSAKRERVPSAKSLSETVRRSQADAVAVTRVVRMPPTTSAAISTPPTSSSQETSGQLRRPATTLSTAAASAPGRSRPAAVATSAVPTMAASRGRSRPATLASNRSAGPRISLLRTRYRRGGTGATMKVRERRTWPVPLPHRSPRHYCRRSARSVAGQQADGAVGAGGQQAEVRRAAAAATVAAVEHLGGLHGLQLQNEFHWCSFLRFHFGSAGQRPVV